jgi:hypothetical protein
MGEQKKYQVTSLVKGFIRTAYSEQLQQIQEQALTKGLIMADYYSGRTLEDYILNAGLGEFFLCETFKILRTQ